jgi:hypothetical protein
LLSWQVLVKIAPVGLCEPQQGEQLTFSITTDRGIDVAGFKRAVAEKMKCQPAAFDLLCHETLMREEEAMAEALESSNVADKKGRKMRWPKGYAGEQIRHMRRCYCTTEEPAATSR